jgi:hypothetical protein
LARLLLARDIKDLDGSARRQKSGDMAVVTAGWRAARKSNQGLSDRDTVGGEWKMQDGGCEMKDARWLYRCEKEMRF